MKTIGVVLLSSSRFLKVMKGAQQVPTGLALQSGHYPQQTRIRVKQVKKQTSDDVIHFRVAVDFLRRALVIVFSSFTSTSCNIRVNQLVDFTPLDH
jgi:hypothetical protein